MLLINKGKRKIQANKIIKVEKEIDGEKVFESETVIIDILPLKTVDLDTNESKKLLAMYGNELELIQPSLQPVPNKSDNEKDLEIIALKETIDKGKDLIASLELDNQSLKKEIKNFITANTSKLSELKEASKVLEENNKALMYDKECLALELDELKKSKDEDEAKIVESGTNGKDKPETTKKK